MKAVYLDFYSIQKGILFDVITYYNLFLLMEKSVFGCSISHYIYTWNNRNNWTDDFIIERTRQLYSEDKLLQWEKDIAQLLKIYRKIKAKKIRNKNDAVFLNLYRSDIENMRRNVLEDNKKQLDDSLVDDSVELITPDIVEPIEFFKAKTRPENCDRFMEIIKNTLFSEEEFLIFNPTTLDNNIIEFFGGHLPPYSPYVSNPEAGKNWIYWFNPPDEYFSNLTEPEKFIVITIPKMWKETFLSPKDPDVEYSELLKPENDISEPPDFFSIFLFRMPLSGFLENEQLAQTRASMQRYMTPLTNLLKELQSEVADMVYDYNVREKVKSFYQKLQPETEILQKRIDSELHLRYLVNATVGYGDFQLNAAVTSIEKITQLFEKNGVLIDYKADALRKELALHTDIKKCRVILYWRGNRFKENNEQYAE